MEIPKAVSEFCDENGWSDPEWVPFERRWWAYPPNGVMPVPVPVEPTAWDLIVRDPGLLAGFHAWVNRPFGGEGGVQVGRGGELPSGDRVDAVTYVISLSCATLTRGDGETVEIPPPLAVKFMPDDT